MSDDNNNNEYIPSRYDPSQIPITPTEETPRRRPFFRGTFDSPQDNVITVTRNPIPKPTSHTSVEKNKLTNKLNTVDITLSFASFLMSKSQQKSSWKFSRIKYSYYFEFIKQDGAIDSTYYKSSPEVTSQSFANFYDVTITHDNNEVSPNTVRISLNVNASQIKNYDRVVYLFLDIIQYLDDVHDMLTQNNINFGGDDINTRGLDKFKNDHIDAARKHIEDRLANKGKTEFVNSVIQAISFLITMFELPNTEYFNDLPWFRSSDLINELNLLQEFCTKIQAYNTRDPKASSDKSIDIAYQKSLKQLTILLKKSKAQSARATKKTPLQRARPVRPNTVLPVQRTQVEETTTTTTTNTTFTPLTPDNDINSSPVMTPPAPIFTDGPFNDGDEDYDEDQDVTDEDQDVTQEDIQKFIYGIEENVEVIKALPNHDEKLDRLNDVQTVAEYLQRNRVNNGSPEYNKLFDVMEFVSQNIALLNQQVNTMNQEDVITRELGDITNSQLLNQLEKMNSRIDSVGSLLTILTQNMPQLLPVANAQAQRFLQENSTIPTMHLQEVTQKEDSASTAIFLEAHNLGLDTDQLDRVLQYARDEQLDVVAGDLATTAILAGVLASGNPVVIPNMSSLDQEVINKEHQDYLTVAELANSNNPLLNAVGGRLPPVQDMLNDNSQFPSDQTDDFAVSSRDLQDPVSQSALTDQDFYTVYVASTQTVYNPPVLARTSVSLFTRLMRNNIIARTLGFSNSFIKLLDVYALRLITVNLVVYNVSSMYNFIGSLGSSAVNYMSSLYGSDPAVTQAIANDVIANDMTTGIDPQTIATDTVKTPTISTNELNNITNESPSDNPPSPTSPSEPTESHDTQNKSMLEKYDDVKAKIQAKVNPKVASVVGGGGILGALFQFISFSIDTTLKVLKFLIESGGVVVVAVGTLAITYYYAKNKD